MYNLFENVPQTVTDLIMAMGYAERDYMDTKKQFNIGELEKPLLDLPDYFGKFLSCLNLQNEFTRLGIWIRSFDDVYRVMMVLNTMIVDRVEADPSDEVRINLERLFYLCTEVARIKAAFTIEPTIHPDDDDLFHDVTFSEN
ncbi:MAG: hypothetical protein JWQ66_2330 [Mucilaginibacter sp.]|nr:hypothetical protein [Mucilaginibacter sp.]